jgi:hypothetical protein
MPRDIVDDRLLGALHLRAMDLPAFVDEPTAEHVAFQAGTLDALLAGHFDGDATMGKLREKGDHGIGTIARLDGEMVIVDGAAFVIDAEGAVRRVPGDTTTPFAVVCRFAPAASVDVADRLSFDALCDLVVGMLPDGPSVLAVRVDGEFADLHLRSVRAQQRAYPSLTEVTAHQTEWMLPAASSCPRTSASARRAWPTAPRSAPPRAAELVRGRSGRSARGRCCGRC